MLFKNLKSGNLIDVKDVSVIEMMKRSPIYEAVTVKAPAPVSASEPAKSAKKPAKSGKEKTTE